MSGTLLDPQVLENLSPVAVLRTERILGARVAELTNQLAAAEDHLAALTGRRVELGLAALPVDLRGDS